MGDQRRNKRVSEHRESDRLTIRVSYGCRGPPTRSMIERMTEPATTLPAPAVDGGASPAPPLDRSAAIAQLTRHATGGELTLDEYADCAAAIAAATTPAELEARATSGRRGRRCRARR
jgi:hypothetical protein